MAKKTTTLVGPQPDNQNADCGPLRAKFINFYAINKEGLGQFTRAMGQNIGALLGTINEQQ